MSTSLRFVVVLNFALVAMASTSIEAGVILYSQDFESPTGFFDDGGDINIFRPVNQLYGNQPPGFSFAQANTVETLRVTGNQAFGTGYSDPQGTGGDYALGMLSGFGTENDLLGLSFDVQGQNFLNFRLNISSIDLDRFGGPFNPDSGSVPTFDLVLYDNPTGANGLSGNATVLDESQITGAASQSRSSFNWTEHTLALNASNSTNGKVTLRIDLVASTDHSRYAAMDNFLIVASNTPGDVDPSGAVPEPASMTIFGIGLAGLLASRRKKCVGHRC